VSAQKKQFDLSNKKQKDGIQYQSFLIKQRAIKKRLDTYHASILSQKKAVCKLGDTQLFDNLGVL